MNRLLVCALLFPLALLLGGCGGHVYRENDKDLEIEDFDLIQVGMSEAEVVEKLGLPVSYGVDAEGRSYLQYAETNTAAISASASYVVAGSVVSGVMQGFEGFIYFDDNGKVFDIQVKEYQE